MNNIRQKTIQDIEDLDKHKSELIWTNKTYKTDNENLKHSFDDLFIEVDKLSSLKLSHKSELDKLKTTIGTLGSEKQTLENDIEVSKDKLASLAAQENELDIKTQAMKQQYDAYKNQKELRIQELERTLNKLTNDILESQNIEQVSREDIAKRQMLLDKREEVLKIRERKVEMSEQTIQNNSNLLNL